MNFTSRNKFFTPSLTALFLLIFSISGLSQSEKKNTEHADEKHDADAAAVAYINCKQAVAKYYSDNKPNDVSLRKELKSISLLQDQINSQVARMYIYPPEKQEKFNKEVNSLKKDLKTCIKYQNILNANAKLKEMKTQ